MLKCTVTAIFATIIAVYGCATFMVLRLITNVQPTPYLDEVFHIPQGKNYCRGKIDECEGYIPILYIVIKLVEDGEDVCSKPVPPYLKWNSKITTLPGLYIISSLFLQPLSAVLGKDLCTTYGLRFVNVVGCLCNLIILYRLHKKVHSKKKGFFHILKSLAAAVNMSLLPVLYFFSFLYYTDVLSTTFVLLMYLFVLKKSYYWSAFAGFMSLILRQTNVVWVMHSFIIAFGRCVQDIQKKRTGENLLKEEDALNILKTLLTNLVKLWNEGGKDLEMAMKLFMDSAEGYLAVIFSFICFVFINGGIVAGDKSAHISAINIPQVFYFLMFFTFFSIPYGISHIKRFIKSVFVNKWKMTAALLLCVLIIYLNTEVHPYLLADNRHYTFYVWKRVYERHYLCKYLMVGVYLFGAYVVSSILRRTEPMFHLAFLICFILCLVPQKLLEFRYFIIPFLLLRLQIVMSVRQLVFEFMLFTGINYITIYIFATKTFFWKNSEDVQRFLW